MTAKAPPPKGQLRVVVKSDKMAIGAAAAQHVPESQCCDCCQGLCASIFAAGASQFEFIEALLKLDVQWDKVTCFHLDEYVGLPDDRSASFAKYLRGASLTR